MKTRRILSSLGLVTTAALTLVACGKNNNSKGNENAKEADKFPEAVPKKTAKNGGTVRVALETDTPFTGIFSSELSMTAIDDAADAPGNESLFGTDDHFKINDSGPATLKLDRKAKTATITVKKGVKWSDGKQVTAKDVEFPYELMANKKTNSMRYGSQFENIKGMKEYHNGKSKTISGIEMPDGENGRVAVIHFKEMKPGMYNSGNGYFWELAEPYHYLKGIPFDKLQSSDQIRKNPLFFGPYKMDKVVRGQSTTWSPNKYYWRGKPHLDKIVVSVVSQKTATQAIKSHKFDVAAVINSQWKQVKNVKNTNFVAKVPLAYNYIGFKVGKWSNKKGEAVMNKNAKMANKSLRQAIGYAMNVDEVYKHYTDGLSFRVPTLIPAQYGDYFDKSVKGYNYNLKKANQLLDKAGYKKKGKWRVQPNGKPLTIHYLAKSGDAINEPIVQNYIQQWKKVGLNVKLIGGRLTEFNSFYDKVEHDDPQIDIFDGGWSLSSEPSPIAIYGSNTSSNFTRYNTPKNNQLLEEIDSQKAFDHKYRVQKFHEWQQYMFDEAYVIPTTNDYSITAVNNKLTGYSTKPSAPVWYDLAYTK